VVVGVAVAVAVAVRVAVVAVAVAVVAVAVAVRVAVAVAVAVAVVAVAVAVAVLVGVGLMIEVGVGLGFEEQLGHGSHPAPRDSPATASNRRIASPADREVIADLLCISSAKSAVRPCEFRSPPKGPRLYVAAT
jgi:hypothetical protein